MVEQPWPEERKTLVKKRLSTGTHHYFLEVKVANNGTKYLVIDQRKKVGEQFVSCKMRIFADEMPELQRLMQKMIQIVLTSEERNDVQNNSHSKHDQLLSVDANLSPAFFDLLISTHDWREFEKYTYYLLKSLGIPTLYHFLGDRQAGRADGFFKIGNLAVIYDCTIGKQEIEQNKKDQIINYCNRLQHGSLEISNETTEEFQNYQKQVWIITRSVSRRIRVINGVDVKEISVQDIMDIYRQHLVAFNNSPSLETRLRDIGITAVKMNSY